MIKDLNFVNNGTCIVKNFSLFLHLQSCWGKKQNKAHETQISKQQGKLSLCE